jgi:hypothetical protein
VLPTTAPHATFTSCCRPSPDVKKAPRTGGPATSIGRPRGRLQSGLSKQREDRWIRQAPHPQPQPGAALADLRPAFHRVAGSGGDRVRRRAGVGVRADRLRRAEVTEQLALPITAGPCGASCGYCGGPLTKQLAGVYRCEPCQPGLARVRTVDDWRAFARRAAARAARDHERDRRLGRTWRAPLPPAAGTRITKSERSPCASE